MRSRLSAFAACTALYLIPRTNMLVAILRTVYLGAATATQIEPTTLVES